MDLRKSLAPVLTYLALVLLPLFISFHLVSLYRRTSQDFEQLIRNLDDTGILERLTRATLLSSPNHGENLRPSGKPLQLVPASEFPTTTDQAREMGCAPENPSLDLVVSGQCVSVVVLAIRREPSNAEIRSAFRDLHIGERLQELGERAHGARKSEEESSLVLFSHVILQTPDHELLFVYPGTYLDPQYDFTARPWYQRKVVTNQLALSGLYHEYVYRKPVITATRFGVHGDSVLQLGVDISMPAQSPSLTIFLFNLLFASLALYLYWRSHQNLRASFLLPLITSTALLAVTYIMLSIGAICVMEGVSSISLPGLVAGVSFIPNGSFLVLSAQMLKKRKNNEAWVVFFFSLAGELACAGAGLLLQTQLFSALFAAFCLCHFGLAVYNTRSRYTLDSPEEVVPNPATLGILILVAYSLWGLCQLFPVAVEVGWHHIAQLTTSNLLREIVLDESTPFTLLLYAKCFALLLTVLYLSSIDQVRRLRASNLQLQGQRIGVLYLDDRGCIVRHAHLPSTFPDPEGRSVFELLEDPVDQAEMRRALEEQRVLHNYVCRFGPLEDRRMLGLALHHPDGEEELSPLIFEHRSSWEDSLSAALLPALRHDITTLLKRFEAQGSSQGGDLGSVEQRAVAERLRLLETELSTVSGIAEGAELMRLPVAVALDEIRLKALALGKSVSIPSEKIVAAVSVPLAFSRAWLRISPRVYSLILYCIFSDLERHLANGYEGEFRLGAEPMGSEFFEVIIRVDRIAAMEDEGSSGYSGVTGGVRPSLERTNDLQLAAYLLNVFNGRLLVHGQAEASTNLRIRLRFLHSTLGEY